MYVYNNADILCFLPWALEQMTVRLEFPPRAGELYNTKCILTSGVFSRRVTMSGDVVSR